MSANKWITNIFLYRWYHSYQNHSCYQKCHRNWELASTASFSFPFHPFLLPPSLPTPPLTPPLFLPLTPSSRDFITICDWWNKPFFYLLLYFLHSIYLPQHILLNFPSVTSLDSFPFLSLCYRNHNKYFIISKKNIWNSIALRRKRRYLNKSD